MNKMTITIPLGHIDRKTAEIALAELMMEYKKDIFLPNGINKTRIDKINKIYDINTSS